MADDDIVRFEAQHCTLTIARPHAGVVLLTLVGRDVGELGDAPFRELARDLTAERPIELFIDARAGRGASMDVSGAWAMWLNTNKERFTQVSMLTGSRFIELTAEFVKNFSALGEKMRLYTETAAFEAALHAERRG